MDFQYLQTFCAVISEGSMTAASDKLEITQSSVSQQVRLLEKRFDVKLLYRNSREIKPTVQGQIIYENGVKILSLLQKAKSSIQAISLNLSEEKINISTINSIGLYLVSPVIGSFLRLNNKMRISLSYGTGEDVIRRMQKGSADLVIMPDLRQEYGRDFPLFKKILLFRDSLYFVGSGKNQNLPKTMSFKDLGQFRLIEVDNHYFAFQSLFKQKAREMGLSLEPSFQSDNVGTAKRAIESGLGCGFLPNHSIRKQIRLGRLKIVEIKDFNYFVNVNFYYKPNEKKEEIIDVLRCLIQHQTPSLF